MTVMFHIPTPFRLLTTVSFCLVLFAFTPCLVEARPLVRNIQSSHGEHLYYNFVSKRWTPEMNDIDLIGPC
jgi:hypothetical protein